MKRKLQLSTVIKIKDSLEDIILSSKDYIVKHNNTEIKIDALLVNVKLAEECLVTFKEIIQNENKGKHDDGKTNNYYIYTLSNLKSRKKFLSELEITDKSQLNKLQIEEEIAKIDKKINEIKTKLIEFNSKEISIELPDNLSKLGISI